jgi:alcohol dehydrogenase
MIACAVGGQVIAVDLNDEALACARSFGAVHTVNARKDPDVPGVIGQLTSGGAAVSIDALGARETCRNSVLCLRKRGRHVQAGLMLGDEREVSLPMAQLIAKELEIVGSHGMQAHAYGPLLKMICENRLQPRQLVRKTVALEQAPAELRSMGNFGMVGVTVIDRF